MVFTICSNHGGCSISNWFGQRVLNDWMLIISTMRPNSLTRHDETDDIPSAIKIDRTRTWDWKTTDSRFQPRNKNYIIYIYVHTYIHAHTHTHTHIYIYDSPPARWGSLDLNKGATPHLLFLYSLRFSSSRALLVLFLLLCQLVVSVGSARSKCQKLIATSSSVWARVAPNLTASSGCSWARMGPNRDQEGSQNSCQKECQIKCQKICQIECQIECQNICQIECNQECQIECQNACQIECH